jgi:hypothetical protein
MARLNVPHSSSGDCGEIAFLFGQNRTAGFQACSLFTIPKTSGGIIKMLVTFVILTVVNITCTGLGFLVFVCFLLGSSLASKFYMPTFRNTLFYLHR